jgi:hypothetical protein
MYLPEFTVWARSSDPATQRISAWDFFAMNKITCTLQEWMTRNSKLDLLLYPDTLRHGNQKEEEPCMKCSPANLLGSEARGGADGVKQNGT